MERLEPSLRAKRSNPSVRLWHQGLLRRLLLAMTGQRSGLGEQLIDIVPVHEILDERLEIIGSAVAIIDVVGVLPDIEAEDRGCTMHQRALPIRRLGYLELAALDRAPAPARAELADAGGDEIGFE